MVRMSTEVSYCREIVHKILQLRTEIEELLPFSLPCFSEVEKI